MSSDIQTGNLPERPNRRFKNILLNKRFQLKYTVMIVGVSLLISSILGVFLVEKLRENSRMLSLEGDGNQAFQDQLLGADGQIAWALFLGFAIFNVVLFLLGLFITHRLAGPIFVFQRYIQEIGRGHFPQTRGLRRGDEFTDLLDAIERAVSRLRKRTEREVKLLERILPKVPPDETELRDEIVLLLGKKRDALNAPEIGPEA
ncbi:MAG: hypothetical protein H6729_13365 [Deltaproteobacteria bacterium]|nr:hypothetical protein [Deltaproteobacteria bacterium]